MGLKDRIRRLENRDGACPECGWGAPDMEVEVTREDGWDDEAREPKETEPVEPVYCPVCGRPNIVVVRWPDSLEPTELERRQHEAALRGLRGEGS